MQDGIAISSHARLVIVEGNYTLLDEEPWREITRLCTEKWFVDAEREVVRKRLVGRHLAAGIETDEGEAVRRVEGNDMVNGELIRAKMVRPDVVVWN